MKEVRKCMTVKCATHDGSQSLFDGLLETDSDDKKCNIPVKLKRTGILPFSVKCFSLERFLLMCTTSSRSRSDTCRPGTSVLEDLKRWERYRQTRTSAVLCLSHLLKVFCVSVQFIAYKPGGSHSCISRSKH